MATTTALNSKQKIGARLVDLLNLKPTKETKKESLENQRFDTIWGVKSIHGLGDIVCRLVDDELKQVSVTDLLKFVGE